MAYTSFAHVAGKGDWYRVFIGRYGSEEEARKAAAVLKRRKFRHAIVLKKPLAVEVGEYDSREAADEIEARLILEGYLPYWMPGSMEEGKKRLMVGAFERDDEAFGVMKMLREGGMYPKVVQQ